MTCHARQTHSRHAKAVALLLLLGGLAPLLPSLHAQTQDAWLEDLTPISRPDWNAQQAAHLLSRAGFSGTPAQASQLAKLSPSRAVRQLSRGARNAPKLDPF